MIAAAADSGLDAGRLLRSSLEAVGGRGGGNARTAQGTAPSPASLNEALAALLLGRS